jgi:hypothetical protein
VAHEHGIVRVAEPDWKIIGVAAWFPPTWMPATATATSGLASRATAIP